MSEMRTTEYTPMQTLIRLVAAGARGETVNDLRIDWKEVLPLAAEQHVQSLVACALLHSPELECPNELREYLLNAMRSESSGNLIRRQRIMHLLTELKDAGIDAKVLKGYAVSGCYAHPECRGSVDTDLLIDIIHEKRAVRFLEAHGFRVDPRAATSQHVVCQHKKYGMLELHVELYAELIREAWFQGISVSDMTQEPLSSVEEPDGSFSTLGYTDHLIFLTLHMIKHFILEGLTLRMMLDIALYFACNHRRIDVKRYWRIMGELRYTNLVSCVLWIFIKYGGFGMNSFPGIGSVSNKQISLILMDIEEGGYMGKKEISDRNLAGMEYNRQIVMKSKSVPEYCMYMLWLRVKGGARSMFPSMKYLKRLYPIIGRLPILFPLLWVYRAVSFPIKKVYSGILRKDILTAKSNMPDVAKKRVNMFRELNML